MTIKPPRRPVRVAVVDESELVLAALARWSDERPGCLQVAPWGREVSPSEVDVVLVDPLLHPGWVPPEDHRVIGYSWDDSPLAVRRALRAGAVGFVSKAVQPDALVSALEAVAAGVGVVRHARDSRPRGGLSTRELEVLCWIAEGLDDAEVAEVLRIDAATVAGHVRSAHQRLGVPDRAAAVRWCRQPRASSDVGTRPVVTLGGPGAGGGYPPLRLA